MNRTDGQDLKKCYKAMVRSRKFEEKAMDLYKRGVINGSLHSGIGHEAVSVGISSVLGHSDYIFPHHRGLGSFMYRGTDPKFIMAEWFGKKTGICGGKGGVTHLADKSKNILGISGIVGGTLPIAMGLALSQKIKRTNKIVACFFGDGAFNQGSFHESANLASLWKVPLLYICENNKYAFSTPLEKSSAVPELEKRVSSYNIPGLAVDGMDIMAIKEAAIKAVDRVKSGEGPFFLNCLTYRYYGHSMSDRGNYRTRDEEDKWENKDSIKLLANYLIKNQILTIKDLETIDNEVHKEIEEAVKFAKESPEPTEEDLFKNVVKKGEV